MINKRLAAQELFMDTGTGYHVTVEKNDNGETIRYY